MRELLLFQLMVNDRKNMVRQYKECCSYFRKIQTRNAFANLMILGFMEILFCGPNSFDSYSGRKVRH